MLSSPGIGSGLDVNGIVGQLMAVERQPLLRLAAKEAGVQTQISGFGQLNSALGKFKTAMEGLTDADGYQAFIATSSNEQAVAVSTSAGAAKGTFNIDVLRTAENHRMASSIVFADTNTSTIGTAGDSMHIEAGGAGFDVEIGGKTLAQIRDAINHAAQNTGVTASIINDDSGNRLVLAADASGADGVLSVSYSAADPFGLIDLNTDRDGDSQFTAADLDAAFSLEGQFNVTRSGNLVSDVIEGVTIELKAAGTATINIDRDRGASEAKIKEFVESYNDLLKTVSSLQEGVLGTNSSALRRLHSQLRSVLNSPGAANGNFSSLFEIGVKTNVQLGAEDVSDGQLVLDETALSEALAADESGVISLFTDAEDGLALRFEHLAGSYLLGDGVIASQMDQLDLKLDSINNERARLETRLGGVERRLLDEFGALDVLMTSLQTTSSFLTQQLLSLPSAS